MTDGEHLNVKETARISRSYTSDVTSNLPLTQKGNAFASGTIS